MEDLATQIRDQDGSGGLERRGDSTRSCFSTAKLELNEAGLIPERFDFSGKRTLSSIEDEPVSAILLRISRLGRSC